MFSKKILDKETLSLKMDRFILKITVIVST
jgi:hypothetical protein